MRRCFWRPVGMAVAAATAATFWGVPTHAAVIDGQLGAGEYGAPLAVQTIGTGFGDNQTEANAAYAEINGNRLDILITGNVERNGNRMHLFLDTRAGGSNLLAAGSSFDSQQVAGTTLEIAPEYLISIHEQFGGFDIELFDYANDSNTVLTLTGNPGAPGEGLTATGSGAFDAAWSNDNTLGVDGNAGVANADALTATSGIELSIPFALLGGSPDGDILATVATGSFDAFFANQFLGALPETFGNLGNSPDLTAIDGDQFFTIPVPEPTSALLALAGVAAVTRRR